MGNDINNIHISLQGGLPKQSDPSVIDFWNESIKLNFFQWMVSQNFSTKTAKIYCGATDRIMRNFKYYIDIALHTSASASDVLRNLVNLLSQNTEFIAANNTGHNQLSAALSAFGRFINLSGDKNETIK